ncbi:MAG TPA: hypothetical protein VGG63_07715 [Steroidobacteraceae bacterium]
MLRESLWKLRAYRTIVQSPALWFIAAIAMLLTCSGVPVIVSDGIGITLLNISIAMLLDSVYAHANVACWSLPERGSDRLAWDHQLFTLCVAAVVAVLESPSAGESRRNNRLRGCILLPYRAASAAIADAFPA